MPLLYLLLLSRLVYGGRNESVDPVLSRLVYGGSESVDPVKTTDDNSTIPGNGTSNATVIQCDDEGFFSTYAICAPGKCCSNIPFGITGTIALLTIGVMILSFAVLRKSRGATSAAPKDPTADTNCGKEEKKEKNCEAEKEESLTSQQLAVAAASQSRPIYPAV
ncbi:hypothetical protein PRIPAC_86017 [Pristionchus pacificus]|uniref:Uncharacterized protein n=1 Tax=Pristionchus pacificus TaxID=54126 RepID=A0A2A6BLB0_PRIPA|nr:hypothetical protein PRIPAC_86017 [Pristionchus pacificus]|eukprot:PDM66571.1 hypothetical protein PRIPAC_47988 [Pristionchus pacificus]